jgi:hypothetical protein
MCAWTCCYFQIVAKIYKEVKQVHNIGGPILLYWLKMKLKSSLKYQGILEVII